MTTDEALRALVDGEPRRLPEGVAGVLERSGFAEWVVAASIAEAAFNKRYGRLARITPRGRRAAREERR